VHTFEGDIEVSGAAHASSDIDAAEDRMQFAAQGLAILRGKLTSDDA
jgi:hypothetical protein